MSFNVEEPCVPLADENTSGGHQKRNIIFIGETQNLGCQCSSSSWLIELRNVQSLEISPLH